MSAGHKSARARRGTKVSLVIALLFLGSGTVRLFDGTAMAIAQEVGNTDPANAGRDQAGARDRAERADSILSELESRQELLDQRAEALDRRESDMRASAAAVDQKLDQLAAAEQSLREIMAMAATAAQDDVAKLTAVYEQMKPDRAAAIFQQMDPDFAAGFLSRMETVAAAQIISGLTPPVAYSVSVVLAGRNVNTPTR